MIVIGLTNVVDISGSLFHSLALKNDGTVWAWGENGAGRLGDGTTTDRNKPVKVTGLTGVRAISAGTGHSMAAKADGTVWTWGSNVDGELGDGTDNNSRPTSGKVKNLTDAKAVEAGGHSLALIIDTTPPAVIKVSPQAGAAGVAPGTSVSAAFSESMSKATVNKNTFTLGKKGTTRNVGATITCTNATCKTALLKPTNPLKGGTTYIATVKGGAAGVKDLAGNALAKTWSFTVRK